MTPVPLAPVDDVAARSRWLLFADDTGLADRVEGFLTAAGHDVIVVEPGKQFARLSDRRYTIEPGSADQYGSLMRALLAAGRLPGAIGHFWGYTGEPPIEPDDSAVCQERGFYSLLFLAQALGALGSSAPVSLGVVTTDLHEVTGDEILCPSKATVLGPCRVISAEYPHVTCRAIDLVASEWLLADDPQIAELVAEIVSGAAVCAYRRGHRWLEAIEAARFDEVPDHGSPRLKERGVYLITGGLGGVGLTLAEYLARSVRARLVLTGRHGLPDRNRWAKYVASHGDDDRVSRQIHVIDALERAGAEVTVVAADVSNLSEMRAAVDEAHRKYDGLDGVIHAAGVPGGGVIQLKTPEAASAVLAPKVAGTQALSQAVAGLHLDFFILCSSTTSIFGGGGQVDYCGANAYLDAFAREYARRTGTFTVAINWDAWQRVGMAVNTAMSMPGQMAREREDLLKRGIAPEEGVEAFRRILAHCTTPQIVVSTTSLVRLAAMAAQVVSVRQEAGSAQPERPVAAAPEATLSRYERPDVATAYVAPTDEIERTIASVWQGVLGIAEIGRDDNFFDLGGHSLLLIQVHATLVEKLGRPLAVTDLFQYSTIASLAAHVGGGRREAPVVRVAERSGRRHAQRGRHRRAWRGGFRGRRTWRRSGRTCGMAWSRSSP